MKYQKLCYHLPLCLKIVNEISEIVLSFTIMSEDFKNITGNLN